MIVSGLNVGFTFKDLKKMTSIQLSNFLAAYNEINNPDTSSSKSNIRDATQEDIYQMLM